VLCACPSSVLLELSFVTSTRIIFGARIDRTPYI
jgi:hypothetical protein